MGHQKITSNNTTIKQPQKQNDIATQRKWQMAKNDSATKRSMKNKSDNTTKCTIKPKKQIKQQKVQK